LLALLAVALSCRPAPPRRAVSAFEVRAGVAAAWYASLSQRDRDMLRSGSIRPGMPEVAAYLALGTPAFHWRTAINQRPCKVLLYSGGSRDDIGRAIYSCEGVIAHDASLAPELPCWRLSQVGPRILEKVDYFEGLDLDRQWELAAGILQRGHSRDDVYIGFGEPYNRGIEVREDGTRATTQVFLDHGRESYGLYVTLVDDAVAGWRVPPDRQLTPEAQKRRLAAMERRLIDKLREMDAAAERRHAETVGYFNDVLANQEDFKGALARIDTNVEAVLGERDSEGGPRVREEGRQEDGLVRDGSVRDGAVRDRPAVRVDGVRRTRPKPAVSAPSENIHYGRSCDECNFNIKNGLSCTIPAKKRCGTGDLEKGAGFCVARPTDRAGYCSGRCKSSGDCPSGYSCSELSSGVKLCTR
jgi:hypothetical protein